MGETRPFHRAHEISDEVIVKRLAQHLHSSRAHLSRIRVCDVQSNLYPKEGSA
jgi:hypothetical protein